MTGRRFDAEAFAARLRPAVTAAGGVRAAAESSGRSPIGPRPIRSGGEGMSELATQLAEAEARVAQLRREIAAGPCAQFGHDWKLVGGRNACCEAEASCSCSIPVNVCAKCSDCDYGENQEAADVIRNCAQRRAEDTL